jgi:hypothetical protein
LKMLGIQLTNIQQAQKQAQARCTQETADLDEKLEYIMDKLEATDARFDRVGEKTQAIETKALDIEKEVTENFVHIRRTLREVVSREEVLQEYMQEFKDGVNDLQAENERKELLEKERKKLLEAGKSTAPGSVDTEMANTTVAETEAGSVAGSVAGSSAGSSAGSAAGSAAGSSAGSSAGSAAVEMDETVGPPDSVKEPGPGPATESSPHVTVTTPTPINSQDDVQETTTLLKSDTADTTGPIPPTSSSNPIPPPSSTNPPRHDSPPPAGTSDVLPAVLPTMPIDPVKDHLLPENAPGKAKRGRGRTPAVVGDRRSPRIHANSRTASPLNEGQKRASVEEDGGDSKRRKVVPS